MSWKERVGDAELAALLTGITMNTRLLDAEQQARETIKGLVGKWRNTWKKLRLFCGVEISVLQFLAHHQIHFLAKISAHALNVLTNFLVDF